MLDSARSGRSIKERQSQQDVLLQILPFLNQGLAVERVPDLQIGCYMLMTVLTSKCKLEDKVLVTLMEAVTARWMPDTKKAALMCLSIMAQQREFTKLPKQTFKAIMSIDNLEDEIHGLTPRCRVDKLTLGLILGCIDQLVKTPNDRGSLFVKQMLDCSILDESQASIAVEAFLRKAQNFDVTAPKGKQLQSQLADLLARLSDSKAIGTITQKVIQDSTIDIENIEARLQIVLSAPSRSLPTSSTIAEMAETSTVIEEAPFELAIKNIPTRTAYEVSFLSPSKSYVFGSLFHAFNLSIMSASDLETFTELPVLRKGLALSEPLYFTFFMRIWCGPHPPIVRTAALHVLSKYLSTTNNISVDLQALIPYILVALADSSVKVRRAASELLAQLGKVYKTLLGKDLHEVKIWGAEDLYGQGEQTKNISWLSIQEAVKVIERVLLPGLEEFVLDSEHISRSIAYALRGSTHPGKLGSKAPNVEIKTALRVAFLSFLASHTTSTPLYAVKLTLMKFLEPVEKVGTTSRTKLLLPILRCWVSKKDSESHQGYQNEGIDSTQIDRAVVTVVSPSDRDGVQTLHAILRGEVAAPSPGIVDAAAKRLRVLWPRMKPDTQLSCAETLLELSLNSSAVAVPEHTQTVAKEMLRGVSLSTDILVSMLDQMTAATASAGNTPRPAKRRRMSHGQTVANNPLGVKELEAILRKMIFVLELVESSEPGTHPQLLRSLFRVLGELPLLKSQLDSELAYLQNLILGSLIAIVESFKVCYTLTTVLE